ncbi:MULTISPECIES: aspartate aminotransferase family protein [Mycolicibacterium]|uniref:Aminotransferase n=1 Tax=Mycolicibacterium wolinskyi TaxID=59750 RepID=A0A1X2F1V1_9MYCO|nr:MULTISPECIES: aminotransferase class III-fold pyridoxal phosphate-dependent enzyme [Mycolicibacterium]ORX12421.1 aminotransferase [Mycolicibacterium wolinskyi]
MSTLDSSLEAFRRTTRSVGGGVSSGLRAAMKPHPLFVDHAAGSRVWDLSGIEYVDYVMGWGPTIVGHSHPHIIEAVQAMVPRMQMVGMGHALEYEAAELVLDAVPGTERLLWTNSGTEAVQIALRLARAATGRNRVVKFTKSYHGWHDSVYASLDVDHTSEVAIVGSLGQNPNAITDLIIAQFNDLSGVERILGNARERGIAAVLVDPIMSNAGVVAPAPGFLELLRRLCEQQGVVLIFDQVIAGFRIARGGATERYGVTPDLSVFGKAIAGGFSQSAVAGKASIIDLVTSGVTHAGTYNGNPVSLAAVKATQELLAEPGTYERLEAVSALFHDRVQQVFDQMPGRPQLSRIGSLLSFVAPDHLDADCRRQLWDAIIADMLTRGVVLLPSGKIFLSTAHTSDDVDVTVRALEETSKHVSSMPLR